MKKGMRKEWMNKNYLVIVPCNDGNWVYGAFDDIDLAWKTAFKYQRGYVLVNE